MSDFPDLSPYGIGGGVTALVGMLVNLKIFPLNSTVTDRFSEVGEKMALMKSDLVDRIQRVADARPTLERIETMEKSIKESVQLLREDIKADRDEMKSDMMYVRQQLDRIEK